MSGELGISVISCLPWKVAPGEEWQALLQEQDHGGAEVMEDTEEDL